MENIYVQSVNREAIDRRLPCWENLLKFVGKAPRENFEQWPAEPNSQRSHVHSEQRPQIFMQIYIVHVVGTFLIYARNDSSLCVSNKKKSFKCQ